jgi:hypothetical protein
MSPLLQAVLDLAATRRFAVFHCHVKKKEPVLKGSFYDATTNPETIKRLWRLDYNIGVATGMMSRVLVVDADGSIGVESLHALEAKHGQLPPTLTSASAAGPHFWFRCESPVPCSVDHIGKCIDIRGDGGYVIAPPSIHPDGPIYRWLNDRPLAPAPDWLLQLARKKPAPTISQRAIASMRPRHNGNGSLDAYGRAALEYEVAALAATPQGSRNDALNRATFSLFQLVAGGELSEGEVLARLIDAARANGLMADPNDGPRRVFATIGSGRRAGMQHPRTRSGAA